MNGKTVFEDGRLMFVYSSHATRDRAESALEDYFAEGDVSSGERPIIRKIAGAWRVLFPGE